MEVHRVPARSRMLTHGLEGRDLVAKILSSSVLSWGFRLEAAGILAVHTERKSQKALVMNSFSERTNVLSSQRRAFLELSVSIKS
jgi:hypothetical protein